MRKQPLDTLIQTFEHKKNEQTALNTRIHVFSVALTIDSVRDPITYGAAAESPCDFPSLTRHAPTLLHNLLTICCKILLHCPCRPFAEARKPHVEKRDQLQEGPASSEPQNFA